MYKAPSLPGRAGHVKHHPQRLIVTRSGAPRVYEKHRTDVTHSREYHALEEHIAP